MHKLGLSFISILIGWAFGFIYYVAYMTFFTSWGWPTDVEAILFWTAIFIFIAWLIFVLPLVFLISESNSLRNLSLAPLIGAVAGLVTFLILVGWWTGFWSKGLYLGYALVVGAATGLAYSSFIRVQRRSANKKTERAV